MTKTPTNQQIYVSGSRHRMQRVVSVNMIFGMDAGWAVEGAMGSEYKIDATYLSPHLNMASRTVSACKQYGVHILLSQSVQELISSTAHSKLLHLDTVSIKGSSHVTENFEEAFYKGRDAYLSGNWSEAIKYLEGANEIMVENVMEQRFAKEDLDDQDSLHGWREAGRRRAVK